MPNTDFRRREVDLVRLVKVVGELYVQFAVAVVGVDDSNCGDEE